MSKPFRLLALLASLAACHQTPPPPSPAKAARDIALVESAERRQAPLQRLAPEPVSFADADVPGRDIVLPHTVPHPRADEGCGFYPAASRQAVLVAVPQFGLVRHDGGWETFASDSGAARVSGNLPVKFSSGKHTLRLTDGAAGPDRLVIVDVYGREVYASEGELRCKT